MSLQILQIQPLSLAVSVFFPGCTILLFCPTECPTPPPKAPIISPGPTSSGCCLEPSTVRLFFLETGSSHQAGLELSSWFVFLSLYSAFRVLGSQACTATWVGFKLLAFPAWVSESWDSSHVTRNVLLHLWAHSLLQFSEAVLGMGQERSS